MERDEIGILSQWDKEQNGMMTPKDVSFGSHRKIWWCCDAGHHWQAAVYTRTGSKSGCPFCAGKKVHPDAHNLEVEHPELAKEWHPVKNHDLLPSDVLPGTHRKVWWLCEKGHEWQAQVKSRVNGNGCPFCSNRKIVVGENDMGTTHPQFAAQWHPLKNGAITPEKVVAGSTKKVWWQCDKGHEWQASICSRAGNGADCPVCTGKQVRPGENDLATIFPNLVPQWHPTKNGSMTPQSVTAFSNRKAWWICDRGHEFQTIIAYRATTSTGCPYCTNRKVLPGFNDLGTKEPLVAAQWHPTLNGALTPQMVTVGSRKKVWWQCSAGHVWKAIVYSRAGSQKCGCPVCAGRVKPNRSIQQTYSAKG